MDIRLFFSETGAGEPLLLLHGNGEDGGFFSGQIGAFSAFRRVVAVDTRGHGRSPRGCAPFTLSQFADDLAAFMDGLRISRADILGYSDGGNVALLFALRYPQRVRRLVLCGANLYPTGMRLPLWLAVEVRYALLCAIAPFSDKALRRRELYGLMAVQPHIRAESLGAVTAPALVVAGTRDVIRKRHTRLIARSLPHARLMFVEGGHAVARENPQAFNRTVKDFLMEN